MAGVSSGPLWENPDPPGPLDAPETEAQASAQETAVLRDMGYLGWPMHCATRPFLLGKLVEEETVLSGARH